MCKDIQGWDRISHVCDDGHKGQSCICGEYGEPIHVEGWSTKLNGREMHHEGFDRTFGLQVMSQR